MRPPVRRLAIRASVAAVLLAFTVGGWLAYQTLAIGVAYKAKMLCSGVFVSGRQPEAVLAEIQVDDLAPLRYIDGTVDRDAHTATARALGLLTRQALFRPGLGCALLLNRPAASADDGQRVGGALVARATDQEATSPADERNAVRLRPVIARAFSEPDISRRRRTLAVVVMQHGRIVAEQYADGIESHTPLPGWSMAKSVMNALTGVLVGRGLLARDAPVPIPEWQQAGDPRAAITLDHLLHMSSGLAFDEGMTGPRSDVVQMLFQQPDASAFAIDKTLRNPPGTHWDYSSGTTNILARVMRNVLPASEYAAFPRRALFDRIGMSSAVLETDAAGTFVGSSYMYATARDWARFGVLYLQDGVWNGERVLPEKWVKYSFSPAPADRAHQYGAHFWLQVPEGYAGADPRLPVSAFHAAGHEGQFVTIVPSRALVIVRLGLTRYGGAWDHAAFVREVLSALD